MGVGCGRLVVTRSRHRTLGGCPGVRHPRWVVVGGGSYRLAPGPSAPWASRSSPFGSRGAGSACRGRWSAGPAQRSLLRLRARGAPDQRTGSNVLELKFSESETVCPPSGSSLKFIEVIMMFAERELHARRGVEALRDRLAPEHRLLDLRHGGVVHEGHVEVVDVAVAVRLAEARRVERDDADVLAEAERARRRLSPACGFVSGAVGDGWRASNALTARLPAARWSPSTAASAGSGSASREERVVRPRAAARGLVPSHEPSLRPRPRPVSRVFGRGRPQSRLAAHRPHLARALELERGGPGQRRRAGDGAQAGGGAARQRRVLAPGRRRARARRRRPRRRAPRPRPGRARRPARRSGARRTASAPRPPRASRAGRAARCGRRPGAGRSG